MSNNQYGSYEANDFEDLMELDENYEGDWESGDFEDEMDPFDMEDPDPFLGDVFRTAGRVAGRVARGAGRAVDRLPDLARQVATRAGGAIAGQQGARIGQGVANAVLNNLNWETSDMEEENAALSDLEAIGADSQILQEMSHLATLAAEAETEAEADQFLGAIAGLAGKILPQVLGSLAGGDGEEESYDPERDEFLPALIPLAAQALPMLASAVPQVISTVGKMFRPRRRRRLMETLPVIAAKTVSELVKKAENGKPVSPKTVAAAAAKQITKTIANKPAVVNAIQANKEMAYGGGGSYYRPPARNGYGRPQGSPSAAGYGQRRGRVIRPRYCVY